MAQRTFVQTDAGRVDITDLPRIYEHTCDVCGQYADAIGFTLVTLTVGMAGRPSQQRAYEAHVGCLPELLDKMAAAIDEVYAS